MNIRLLYTNQFKISHLPYHVCSITNMAKKGTAASQKRKKSIANKGFTFSNEEEIFASERRALLMFVFDTNSYSTCKRCSLKKPNRA